ncbi:MAG: hypothetical protein KF752_20780 [Pirellulaceae bacterium]|nr:hypothetical protein [Pirellulaceae bacterium]
MAKPLFQLQLLGVWQRLSPTIHRSEMIGSWRRAARIRLALLVGSLLVVSTSGAACLSAKEPEGRLSAPKLFPDKTVAYLRIDDVRKLRADYAQSTYGKLSADEQLKPIVGEFYGSMIRSTEEAMGGMGLNLDEFLSIPSGELAIAILPRPKSEPRGRPARNEDSEDGEEPQRQMPSPPMALLMDAGDEIAGIQVMLSRFESQAAAESDHLQKRVGSLTLHSYQNRTQADQQFAYFIDDGVLIACTRISYIEDLAKVWLGDAGERKTLAENPRFTALMTRCVGTEGERPQVSFYLDPLAMLREMSSASDEPQAMMLVAMLPLLGLDGLEAIGGSLIVAPADFDSIGHIHVQLKNPRKALLGLLKPKAGQTIPEDWVPDTVSGYSTLNWDFADSFSGLERLYNQLRGEGAWQRDALGPANEQIGIDIRRDIIDSLEGRVTILEGYTRPVTTNSRSNVWAFKYKNIKKFQKDVLPKLMEQAAQRGQVSTVRFGSIEAQVAKFDQESQQPSADLPMRDSETCIAILDDYMLVSDSGYMLQQIADALGDSSSRLNQSLEFQLVHDRIQSQLHGKPAAAITFSRPEQALQQFYEMVREPENRQKFQQFDQAARERMQARQPQSDNPRARELRQRFAGSNPMFGALNQALEKNQLPPFAVISKYMSPSGGFLVDEESGLHYTTFTLQRE